MKITEQQFRDVLNRLPNARNYHCDQYRVAFCNENELLTPWNPKIPPRSHHIEFIFNRVRMSDGTYQWVFDL